MKKPMEAKMLNPTNQSVLTGEKQYLIIKNTGREEKMTTSFSNSHAGIFCFCWKIKDQVQSIWSKNFRLLLELFFKNKNKLPSLQLIYFPLDQEGQMLTVFRGAL